MRKSPSNGPGGDSDQMAEILAELDELIRMGLVAVAADGGVFLTDAGTDAVNAIDAQTWN
jgi:hypothetical protein